VCGVCMCAGCVYVCGVLCGMWGVYVCCVCVVCVCVLSVWCVCVVCVCVCGMCGVWPYGRLLPFTNATFGSANGRL